MSECCQDEEVAAVLRGRRLGSRIVIATAGFAPGFKGGGPIRSLTNLARLLESKFNVRVVTRDRDIGDVQTYVGIQTGVWVRWSHVAIIYCGTLLSLTAAFRSAIGTNQRAILYVNSFFDLRFSVLPLLLCHLGVVRPRMIVVAPRGEFSAGALRIKRRRKRLFFWVMRLLGFHRKVVWHATTDSEADDIRRAIGERRAREIVIAQNLTTVQPWVDGHAVAGDGRHLLKVIFLSRISEKKNLLFVIRCMKKVSRAIELRIAGPVEDEAYWRQCQREIDELPENVSVRLLGAIQSDRVGEVLAETHLFFLPTLGENYGHAIAEALLAGVPVLISDQTPWRNLTESRAGWDLPLGSEGAFAKVIDDCASMTPDQFESLRRSARAYAESVMQQGSATELLTLFRSCERCDLQRRLSTS